MEKIIDTQWTMAEFVTALFETGEIGGLASLMRTPDGNRAAYTLITESEAAADCAPFFPAMPNNAAKAVSRLTREAAPSRPVAVFLRPCELRALVELEKLKQASTENLVRIGFDCGGVFPFQKISFADEEHLRAYREALQKGEPAQGIRAVCSACDAFLPQGADIRISLIGRDMEAPLAVSFPSEKGEEIGKRLGMLSNPDMAASPAVDALMEKRKANRAALETAVGEQLSGFEGLLDTFDACIACRACSTVCPVCYCKNCYFESQTFQYFPESYYQRMQQKGALRLPMDRILFHLGRLSHMGASCVACGMCEDVCPMGIPVAQAFKTVAGQVQDLFEYAPGLQPEAPLPLLTYETEELREMED